MIVLRRISITLEEERRIIEVYQSFSHVMDNKQYLALMNKNGKESEELHEEDMKNALYFCR